MLPTENKAYLLEQLYHYCKLLSNTLFLKCIDQHSYALINEVFDCNVSGVGYVLSNLPGDHTWAIAINESS